MQIYKSGESDTVGAIWIAIWQKKTTKQTPVTVQHQINEKENKDAVVKHRNRQLAIQKDSKNRSCWSTQLTLKSQRASET